MTNKQFEKKYLAYLHKVSKLLLLDSHHPITLTYHKYKNTWATYSPAYPYKSITIKYDASLKGESDEKIKDVLVHEMCHAISDELMTKAKARYISEDELMDAMEEMTDHLANIIRKNKFI